MKNIPKVMIYINLPLGYHSIELQIPCGFLPCLQSSSLQQHLSFNLQQFQSREQGGFLLENVKLF